MWKYRCVKRAGNVGVREVCFHDDGSIMLFGAYTCIPEAESLEKLKEVLERMKDACQEEIIDEEDFK